MKILPNLLATLILFSGLTATPEGAWAQPKGCPPGLAKKSPPCVPPGLAKQGDDRTKFVNRDYIGRILDPSDLIYLDNYSRYDLPRLPYGQSYAVVDNRIVVIDRENYQILQLIRAFTSLVD